MAMPNKLLAFFVNGRQWSRCFEFSGDPRYLAEWRIDGLDIREVVGIVPQDYDEAQEEDRFRWWLTETVGPEEVQRRVEAIFERVRR